MREEQALGARGGVGVQCLLGAQVTARLAVRPAGLERRLADEEVGVAREVCDAWRRVWGTWREQPVF